MSRNANRAFLVARPKHSMYCRGRGDQIQRLHYSRNSLINTPSNFDHSKKSFQFQSRLAQQILPQTLRQKKLKVMKVSHSPREYRPKFSSNTELAYRVLWPCQSKLRTTHTVRLSSLPLSKRLLLWQLYQLKSFHLGIRGHAREDWFSSCSFAVSHCFPKMN